MSGAAETVSELAAQLAAGGQTARALALRSFERLDALDPRLHAFLFTRREAALAEADASDARRARGQARSVLDGLPIAIKDNIVQAGEPASCASRILSGYVSPFDATVVERLRAAGAVIVGRTNLDEFAMGSSTPVQSPEHACLLHQRHQLFAAQHVDQ